MPSQKNNIVMKSTRGMFGKQVVFKRRAGKSYVAAPPEVKEGRVPTDDQEGAAVENEDGYNWIYTTTQANANLSGTKITATATDLPGNSGSFEIAL